MAWRQYFFCAILLKHPLIVCRLVSQPELIRQRVSLTFKGQVQGTHVGIKPTQDITRTLECIWFVMCVLLFCNLGAQETPEMKWGENEHIFFRMTQENIARPNRPLESSLSSSSLLLFSVLFGFSLVWFQTIPCSMKVSLMEDYCKAASFLCLSWLNRLRELNFDYLDGMEVSWPRRLP